MIVCFIFLIYFKLKPVILKISVLVYFVILVLTGVSKPISVALPETTKREVCKMISFKRKNLTDVEL